MRRNKRRALGDLQKIQALWRDRKNQATYLNWLFAYSKPYVPRIVMLTFMNLVSSIISIGTALMTKNIMDTAWYTDREADMSAVAKESAGFPFLSAFGVGGSIAAMVALYVALILVNQVINAVCALIGTVLNERFTFGIRRQIYEKIIGSRWMDIQKYHTGDLSTRLTSDASMIADGIIGTIPDIIKLLLELVVVFFVLFYFSPLMAVLALAMAPLAAFVSYSFGRVLKRLQVKVQESESAYRSFMQESLSNLMIIKSFSNEGYATDRLVQLRDERFRWVFKRTRIGVASSSGMSLAFQFGYIAALAYGAVQVSKRAITFGTMSVFLQLVNRVQAPVLQLAQNLPKLASIAASAGRIMELQDIPAEERLAYSMVSDQIGVKADSVSFAYDDDSVFDDASFTINPGEFVAIIGESGIGKTTLVRLLMSFVYASSGTISFTDTNGGMEVAVVPGRPGHAWRISNLTYRSPKRRGRQRPAR